MASTGDIFKPGDTVPHSGIYRVVHDSHHTKEHEATCVYGKRFPPCNDCGEHPRFILQRLAQHIDSNDNFKPQTNSVACRLARIRSSRF